MAFACIEQKTIFSSSKTHSSQSFSAEFQTAIIQSAKAKIFQFKDLIEATLDLLLNGISDADTSVRWSSAKGLARICQKLPPNEPSTSECRSMTEDVLDHLFMISQVSCSGKLASNSWHGCCLSLAELIRRRLVPIRLLPSITSEILLPGLSFDTHLDGWNACSNVRDASCYILWAMARTYEMQELAEIQDFKNCLVFRHLLNAAIFDREIGVRRAACAAFQECVGRLGEGMFPDGIYFNTIADYFSVGNRRTSYLEVSKHLIERELQLSCAPLENSLLQISFLNHLVQTKLVHWDPQIRSFACETIDLHISLLPDADKFVNEALKQLIFNCQSTKTNEMAGSILGISCILKKPHLKLDISSKRVQISSPKIFLFFSRN